MRFWFHIYISLVLVLNAISVWSSDCPCSQTSLCDPIDYNGKEVSTFLDEVSYKSGDTHKTTLKNTFH